MEYVKLLSIYQDMADMAAKHENDMISNALARVSRKIESMGNSKFSQQLDETDLKVIQYYLVQKGVTKK